MESGTQPLRSNFEANPEPSIYFFLRIPQKPAEKAINPIPLFPSLPLMKYSAIHQIHPSQIPPKMAESKTVQVFLSAIFIFAFLVTSSQSSLLPFIDPFGVLEQTPFGLLENENRDALQQQMQPLPPARVDWKETPESHVIMLDVPGMNKEELKIELDEENRILKVIGERKREEEKQSEHWHRLERSYGKFWRQFRLPINVDLESVKAQLQNGVLKVTLSKLSPEKIKGPRVVGILDEQPPAAELNKSGGARQEL